MNSPKKSKLSSVIKQIIKEELDEFGQTTDDGGTLTGRHKRRVKDQVEKLKVVERTLEYLRDSYKKSKEFDSGLTHLEMAIGDLEEFLFPSKNKSDLDESSSDEVSEMGDILSTAGYADADEWAKKLSDEGMGPSELEHRVKPDQLTKQYGMKKRAGLKTEAVDSKSDKAVINAFTDKKPMTGKLLSTDGKTLKVDGFLGGKCAEWVDGKIQLVAPGGKLSQSVNKAIVKLVPKNWLVGGTGYSGSLKTEGYWEDKKSDDNSNTAVIEAFLTKEKADGNKLSTDGTRLDAHWGTSESIAQWIQTPEGEDCIQFSERGSRAAQEVQRTITKIAPSNWLLNGKGY